MLDNRGRDPAVEAGYHRAMQRRGHWVLIRRVTGNDASTKTTDAKVKAIITGYAPEPDVMAIKPEGGITQNARTVIVLHDDLIARGFPLPLAKNDKVVLLYGPDGQVNGGTVAEAGAEALNIIRVDPYKRMLGGAIEAMAEGV